MNDKKKLSAVIFDMDGLMFDTEDIIRRAWDVVGPQMGFGKMGHHIFNTLGMNAAKRRQYFADACGKDFPFDEFTKKYRAQCEQFMAEYGVPVKDGLLELLDYLKGTGVKLAVATGSSEFFAKEKLSGAGCLSYFEGILCGNMIERSKPDPEIYIKTCNMLDVPCEEALALEDSPYGLQAAVAAGMYTIMVPDLIKDAGEIEQKITAKLPSLHAVQEYIDKYFVI